MATWTKVVTEDSSNHIAQTAAKANHLEHTANNGPEVVFQTNSATTNYLDKGTGYQVLRMNAGATALEYTGNIVETRDVNQTIAGEKFFTEAFGATKPTAATSSARSVSSGVCRFTRSYWDGSSDADNSVQMQVRQDSNDNDDAKWEFVIGGMNSSNNLVTDSIFQVDWEGSATVNKFLKVTGGIIKQSSGASCITLGSPNSGGIKVHSKLQVAGNVIEGSAGNTCITLGTGAGSNGVTIAGDLTVSGATTTVNTATLSVEDKIIELANGATNASTASLSGINVNTTNSTQEPTLLWTDGAVLSGWGVKPEGDTTTYPLAVMSQGTASVSGNHAGVGSFYLDTNGDSGAAQLYIRTV